MEILILVFMTTVSAIVMEYFDTSRANHARPGAIIRRIPQASSPAILEDNSDNLSLIPAAIIDPASPSASAASIETESQALTMTDTPTSICTPVSTCVDKFSICPDRSRKRYGGCYDKNFCDGNTSPYPIPTCS